MYIGICNWKGRKGMGRKSVKAGIYSVFLLFLVY